MGLPIRRLILATNENDVLDEFFRTGRYRPRATARDARDVEPVDGHLQGVELRALRLRPRRPRRGARSRRCGDRLDARRRLRPRRHAVLADACAASGFVSGRSTHADRIATIRDVHERYGVVIDPHTADGVKVGRELRDPGVPLVCIETALPAKFAATIREALGRDPHAPRGVRRPRVAAAALRRCCRADVGARQGRSSRAPAAAA